MRVSGMHGARSSAACLGDLMKPTFEAVVHLELGLGLGKPLESGIERHGRKALVGGLLARRRFAIVFPHL